MRFFSKSMIGSMKLYKKPPFAFRVGEGILFSSAHPPHAKREIIMMLRMMMDWFCTVGGSVGGRMGGGQANGLNSTFEQKLPLLSRLPLHLALQ